MGSGVLTTCFWDTTAFWVHHSEHASFSSLFVVFTTTLLFIRWCSLPRESKLPWHYTSYIHHCTPTYFHAFLVHTKCALQRATFSWATVIIYFHLALDIPPLLRESWTGQTATETYLALAVDRHPHNHFHLFLSLSAHGLTHRLSLDMLSTLRVTNY